MGVHNGCGPAHFAAGSNKRAVTSAGEAALRTGLDEKEDKLGSFTKKAMHIQLDRWGRRQAATGGGGARRFPKPVCVSAACPRSRRWWTCRVFPPSWTTPC